MRIYLGIVQTDVTSSVINYEKHALKRVIAEQDARIIIAGITNLILNYCRKFPDNLLANGVLVT